MASERIQRQIENLLDEAEEAVSRSDWGVARDRAQKPREGAVHCCYSKGIRPRPAAMGNPDGKEMYL